MSTPTPTSTDAALGQSIREYREAIEIANSLEQKIISLTAEFLKVVDPYWEDDECFDLRHLVQVLPDKVELLNALDQLEAARNKCSSLRACIPEEILNLCQGVQQIERIQIRKRI